MIFQDLSEGGHVINNLFGRLGYIHIFHIVTSQKQQHIQTNNKEVLFCQSKYNTHVIDIAVNQKATVFQKFVFEKLASCVLS